MARGLDAKTFDDWCTTLDDEELVTRVFDFCHFTKSHNFRPKSWRDHLLPGFEIVCGPWLLMSECLNGGFCQYLCNWESRASMQQPETFMNVEATLRALRLLQLSDIEQLLRSAIELNNLRPEVSADDKRWRPLDIGFNKLHDAHPIQTTLAAYIRAHRDEFVKPGVQDRKSARGVP